MVVPRCIPLPSNRSSDWAPVLQREKLEDKKYCKGRTWVGCLLILVYTSLVPKSYYIYYMLLMLLTDMDNLTSPQISVQQRFIFCQNANHSRSFIPDSEVVVFGSGHGWRGAAPQTPMETFLPNPWTLLEGLCLGGGGVTNLVCSWELCREVLVPGSVAVVGVFRRLKPWTILKLGCQL